MNEEIWVLGATGRVGAAAARRLDEAGAAQVLVARDRRRLERVAAGHGRTPRLVVGTLDSVLPEVRRAAPAVVVNTVGPFTDTAPRVVRSCPPGTHYVDVANELGAVREVLALDREAAGTDRVLVTGAGFGVLATESVLLHVTAGLPPASRVRVDALPSVATEEGAVGSSLAASIVEVAALGGRVVRGGRLAHAPIGGQPVRLTTPDGDLVRSASVPSGELLAAWRISGAGSVVAASSLAPAGRLSLVMPLLSAALRIPGASGLAARRLARVRVPGRPRPRRHSWAHARADWTSGEVREGWLRVGEGMEFTVAAAVEVALRLARGEGRPGAHTPAALFGAELALAAGGEFIETRTPAPGAGVG